MTGDEILGLMRLGIFDRGKPADREIMLNLLDQPKEMPMTWDGVPEHRNLGGGEQPAKTTENYKRQLRDWLAGQPDPDLGSAADYFREQAARLAPRSPEAAAAEDPADPFAGLTELSGMDEGAAATHEMFRSHVKAGFTEQQTLFYLACLMQVGHALKAGGLLPPPLED